MASKINLKSVESNLKGLVPTWSWANIFVAVFGYKGLINFTVFPGEKECQAN